MGYAKTEYDLEAARGRLFYADSQMEALLRVVRWLQEAEEMDCKPSILLIRFDEQDPRTEQDPGETTAATVFYEAPGKADGGREGS